MVPSDSTKPVRASITTATPTEATNTTGMKKGIPRSTVVACGRAGVKLADRETRATMGAD
jgi:hypothetical protein